MLTLLDLARMKGIVWNDYPHFSPLSQSTQEPSSLGAGKGQERRKESDRNGGWRLKGSTSQRQKFHRRFQAHIGKQIHLSHHQSLTGQLYRPWALGWTRTNRGGQRMPMANAAAWSGRLRCLPWRPDRSVIPQERGCLQSPQCLVISLISNKRFFRVNFSSFIYVL